MLVSEVEGLKKWQALTKVMEYYSLGVVLVKRWTNLGLI